jgi:uncharacterized protein YcsI (UPF0317 family)
MDLANRPAENIEADRAFGIDLSNPTTVRHAIRSGAFTGFTNTVAHGYVQGNLVVLPAEYSTAFRDFCARNPRPCPLLGESERGDPHIPSLAKDMDLRTDVGEYRIFRDGTAVATARDINNYWRNDLVAFVLGCSFSFEQELMNEGITLRHIVEKNVSPMYVTNVDNVPAGPFGGKLVVSMRGLRPAEAIRAIEITSRFPQFHGAPVHIGKPELIGIDLDRPYGGHGLTTLQDDELPVFWACGATSQMVVELAKLPFAITHSKAHMVVTDLKANDFANTA